MWIHCIICHWLQLVACRSSLYEIYPGQSLPPQTTKTKSKEVISQSNNQKINKVFEIEMHLFLLWEVLCVHKHLFNKKQKNPQDWVVTV